MSILEFIGIRPILNKLFCVIAFPILISAGLLSYLIAKRIPKYCPYCNNTFRECLRELWWAIRVDWKGDNDI